MSARRQPGTGPAIPQSPPFRYKTGGIDIATAAKTTTKSENVDTGIAPRDHKEVAKALQHALGETAPASFGDYTKMSVVDSSETPREAEAMIRGLITDNESIAKRMRDFVEVAEDADDVFTADMLTARIGKHEENAWMLRALIS